MTGVESGVDAKFWLDLFQWVFTVLIGVYAWNTNRQRARQQDIDAIRDSMVTLHTRIDHAESRIEHLPSKEDFMEIRIGLERVHAPRIRLFRRCEIVVIDLVPAVR